MREFIGAFSAFLDVQTALVSDYGVIYALEEAQKLGLINVWLECDSALVYAAFTARTNVSWMLRNRWNTCLIYCGKIRFRVTHIFREGKACADKLANLGFIQNNTYINTFIHHRIVTQLNVLYLYTMFIYQNVISNAFN